MQYSDLLWCMQLKLKEKKNKQKKITTHKNKDCTGVDFGN